MWREGVRGHEPREIFAEQDSAAACRFKMRLKNRQKAWTLALQKTVRYGKPTDFYHCSCCDQFHLTTRRDRHA